MRQFKCSLLLASVLIAVSAAAFASTTAGKAEPADNEKTVRAEVDASAHGGSSSRLDGAKVYAMNCGSCHSERYPNERSDAEWDIIIMHMKVRANLTSAEASAVLAYLKGNN